MDFSNHNLYGVQQLRRYFALGLNNEWINLPTLMIVKTVALHNTSLWMPKLWESMHFWKFEILVAYSSRNNLRVGIKWDPSTMRSCKRQLSIARFFELSSLVVCHICSLHCWNKTSLLSNELPIQNIYLSTPKPSSSSYLIQPNYSCAREPRKTLG